MSHPSILRFEEKDDVLVFRLLSSNLFDPMAAREMADELLSVIDDRKPRKMLASFSEVDRCSTDVINALLLVKKRLLSEGGDLVLCEMRENIRHTYQILNLDGTVFRIFDSSEDALDALALDSTI